MKPPVSFSVDELSDTTIESLALQIAEQQKKEVGTTYGYCSYPGCGFPLCKSTVWKAKKRGGEPRCRVHFERTKSEDKKVYLCTICRCVLTGPKATQAQRASKKGSKASCGSAACRLALRGEVTSKPRLPCTICGEPSTQQSSTRARNGRTKSYCDKLSCRNCAIINTVTKAAAAKPRGLKTTRASSAYIGVSISDKKTRWVSSMSYKGRQIKIGNFTTEIEAAQAYDIAACDILGINAKLNFGEPLYI